MDLPRDIAARTTSETQEPEGTGGDSAQQRLRASLDT